MLEAAGAPEAAERPGPVGAAGSAGIVGASGGDGRPEADGSQLPAVSPIGAQDGRLSPALASPALSAEHSGGRAGGAADVRKTNPGAEGVADLRKTNPGAGGAADLWKSNSGAGGVADLRRTSDVNLPAGGGSGYGLVNVQARMQVTFGGEYGITVESEPGVGTTVTLTHPILYEDPRKGE